MSDICSAPGDDSEAVMKSSAVNRASLIYPSEQMSGRNKRSGAPTMLAANAGRSKDQLSFLFSTRLMKRTRATRQSRGLDTESSQKTETEMEDPRQLMSL